MENEANVIILATEITKGMKSVGPKSLLRLNKSLSVIDHQIIELQKIQRNINITVATGFESDKMEKTLNKYGVRTIYNENFKNTNQVKSIVDYLCSFNVNNLLIINSGILFKTSFFELEPAADSKSVLYLLDKQKQNFEIGCNDSRETNYLFYDLPQKWIECVFFNAEAISKIKTLIKSKNIDQLYTFELINILIDQGLEFHKKIIPKNTIMKITNTKDLNKAKAFI